MSEVAIRLLLTPEAPVSWELATAAGDDVRLPRDDEIVGFGTDGAAGAFADASGWDVLADRYRRYLDEEDDDAGETLDEGYLRTTDEVTSGDLVSFLTEGDGTLPVWLGRSRTGDPVSVVVVTDWLPGLRLLGAADVSSG